MSFNKIILEQKVREFLREDCIYNDVSSKVIPKNANASAKIFAKNAGYFSGMEELKILFDFLNIEIDFKKKDGDTVEEGDIISQLKGNARDILLGERVGLNLITHMSAITSTVKKFVKIINHSGKKVKIACTRKTTPGMRIFEKKAVELGGGDTHRFSLDDMVLLKDTHLRYYNGDVKKLLKDTKEIVSFTKKIEIEVENVEDALIAAQNGADIIMLDNLTPDDVEEAMNLLKKHNLRDKVIIEISGGITPENIIDYLISEPDFISSGLITQFPSEQVDFSLRFD
ncbi:MAG: carboxylating nicotinate-nucleotide diphosphorylase [Promethearchaeota archaeon]|nr:MAG: carboxylating nicotinate-nucleotide diphosphorylase [Candidatus Lokiarchaeota archaeon]